MANQLHHHIKMTPEILIRYHRGLASYEEILAVASWLEDDHFEPLDTSASQSPDKEAEICSQIWQRLLEQQKAR